MKSKDTNPLAFAMRHFQDGHMIYLEETGAAILGKRQNTWQPNFRPNFANGKFIFIKVN